MAGLYGKAPPGIFSCSSVRDTARLFVAEEVVCAMLLPEIVSMDGLVAVTIASYSVSLLIL